MFYNILSVSISFYNCLRPADQNSGRTLASRLSPMPRLSPPSLSPATFPFWPLPSREPLSFSEVCNAIFNSQSWSSHIVVISAAEVAGKLIFDRGIASQVRPRKYYTIPRESLERSLEDVEQLVNFFVIEFQRIIFAENIYATITVSTLIEYHLTDLTFLGLCICPHWLASRQVRAKVGYRSHCHDRPVHGSPRIHFQQRIYRRAPQQCRYYINDQTSQMRDMAAQHTGRASEVAKSTFSQYSAKAQEMIGQAKGSAHETAASPNAPNPANLNPVKNEPEREFKSQDFPSAPSTAPMSDSPSSAAHTSEVPISEPGFAQ